MLGGAAIRPRREAMHDDTSRLLVTSVVPTLDERERCFTVMGPGKCIHICGARSILRESGFFFCLC